MRRLRTWVKKIDVDRSDVIVVVGLALVALGCWDAYRPAAFLVPGAVLIWYGLPARPSFLQKRGR
jgi:hypothetical protein